MKPECEMLRRFLTDPTCKSEECVSIDVISETLSEKYRFEITPKMIKGCINHWNKLRNKLYIDMKEHDLLSGNPKEDWDFVTSDFVDKYRIIPLSFKRSRGIMGTYITASYEEQEEIETANVVHKIKGLETQLKHMHLIGAKFQITGKTPYELLGNAKEMKTKVLNGKVTEIVNEENVYKEEDFKNEIIEKLESEIIDEENVPKEETSKEQPNEKTLREISFLKEKIARLEAEGRNRNTRILERLEERLNIMTSKVNKSKETQKIDDEPIEKWGDSTYEQNLKGIGIFNKKTADGIEKFNKIEEESIEKWGESAYEENELNKIKSKKEVVETPKVEVVETPKVDVLVENLEEIPKENIKKIRRIIRRIIIPKEEASENVELKKDETKEEFT